MEKLNGKKKIKVSVFISGRGTNLKSLINFSKHKKSLFSIKLIICNNKNAKDGLQQKLFFCKRDKYQITLGRISNKLLGKN